MIRVTVRSGGWIGIGDTADLMPDAFAGKPLTFTAICFVPDLSPAFSVRPDPAPRRPGPSTWM
jgi:hypothetical protein